MIKVMGRQAEKEEEEDIICYSLINYGKCRIIL